MTRYHLTLDGLGIGIKVVPVADERVPLITVHRACVVPPGLLKVCVSGTRLFGDEDVVEGYDTGGGYVCVTPSELEARGIKYILTDARAQR